MFVQKLQWIWIFGQKHYKMDKNEDEIFGWKIAKYVSLDEDEEFF